MSKGTKIKTIDVDAKPVFCKDCARSLGRLVSADAPVALFCTTCRTWTSADEKIPHPLAVKPGGWRR